MARAVRNPVEKIVRDTLKESGLPFSIETRARHLRITINGRFVGIICNGPAHRRDPLQILSAIRRTIRSMTTHEHT